MGDRTGICTCPSESPWVNSENFANEVIYGLGKDPAAVLDDNAEPGWGEENRRLAFLRKVELFRGINREALITVAMELQPKSVVEGAIVCRENDRVDDFYLIESGTLVMTVDVGGHFAELARLGAGQFFGEAALLGLGVHGAAVRAVTAAAFGRFPGLGSANS